MVAVGLIVVLGRRLTGSPAAGLFAGLIAAVTPRVAYYAQTARPYAMVFAVVVATTLTLVVAVEAEVDRARGVRWWVLYGALVTVLGYLNLLALLLLVAHGATLLWARVERGILLRWLTAGAAGAILVTPLLALSMRQTAQVSWIRTPTWHSLKTLWHGFFAGSLPIAALVLACAVVGFVAWLRKPAERRGGAGEGPNLSLPVVATPVAVMPTALLMAASVVHPIFDIRYVIYGESGVALLAGAGVVTLGRLVARFRLPTWLPGVAVCAVVLLGQLSTQRALRLPARNADYGPLVDYVAASSRPGDGVLFLSSFFRKIELAYPTDFSNVDDFALAKTPAQVGNYRGRLLPFSAIRPRLLAHDRVWTIGPSYRRAGHQGPAAGSPAGEQLALLQSRYRVVTHRRFGPVVLKLWQRARG
jgi:mannosyltransferase